MSSNAPGEHTEVYDAEMIALKKTAEEVQRMIRGSYGNVNPKLITFYADNVAVINKISSSTPGKAQGQSMAFRETITQILDEQEDNKVAISWCPATKVSRVTKEPSTYLGIQSANAGPQLRTRKHVLFGCSYAPTRKTPAPASQHGTNISRTTNTRS